MVNRVTIPLNQSEFRILSKMAMKELRNPTDQAHFILRRELERRKQELLDAGNTVNEVVGGDRIQD